VQHFKIFVAFYDRSLRDLKTTSLLHFFIHHNCCYPQKLEVFSSRKGGRVVPSAHLEVTPDGMCDSG